MEWESVARDSEGTLERRPVDVVAEVVVVAGTTHWWRQTASCLE